MTDCAEEDSDVEMLGAHSGQPTPEKKVTRVSTTTSSQQLLSPSRRVRRQKKVGAHGRPMVYYGGKCPILRDEFKIMNEIHSGTYGVVYRVKHKKSGINKAFKELKVDSRTSHSGFPKTGLREMQILSKLKHKNLVVLEGIYLDDKLNKVGMVMEFCEQDLHAILKVQPNPFNTVLFLFLSLFLSPHPAC